MIRIKRKCDNEPPPEFIALNKKTKTRAETRAETTELKEFYQRIDKKKNQTRSAIDRIIDKFEPMRLQMDQIASYDSSAEDLEDLGIADVEYFYYRKYSVLEHGGNEEVAVVEVDESEVAYVKDFTTDGGDLEDGDELEEDDQGYDEDSNAEDYYLNDYPDESSSASDYNSEGSDDDDDPFY